MPPAPAPAALRVVAGILRDGSGRVLIAQRPPGKHMAGHWEFPGGKVASGESDSDALVRELAEELGITVRGSRELLVLVHDYPERRVQLCVREVAGFDGEPRGLEGQALRWVEPAALGAAELLPADGPIIDFLNAEVV
ncbi:MAG TPA: 8-oxo-dGTP diphosphatase MutT [Steroidobacteraceae bacterium]|nr:8-oxo-dGTP diphosphatase MutT [Steroidobacteraceae bacterium]